MTQPAMEEDTLEDDVLAQWSLGDDGGLIVDLRAYDDGCQIVAIDISGDEGEEQELLLSAGLAELDALIATLTEARAKIAALPSAQQGAPELGEEEEEVDG